VTATNNAGVTGSSASFTAPAIYQLGSTGDLPIGSATSKLAMLTASPTPASRTANGNNPSAALIQGTDGNFYGTTSYGGPSNLGVVFSMTPAGTR